MPAEIFVPSGESIDVCADGVRIEIVSTQKGCDIWVFKTVEDKIEVLGKLPFLSVIRIINGEVGFDKT